MTDHKQTDNSNTQFAILALWAAGRHNLPLERSLALVNQRFRTSQGPNGNWWYCYNQGGGGKLPTASMTAAGLLGLAVGHGLVAADLSDKGKALSRDPQIEKGLLALGEYVGRPLLPRPRFTFVSGKAQEVSPTHSQAEINLYFLWSVERVGLLYGLRAFGDKDWYFWGTQMLLDRQQVTGAWNVGGYPGATPVIDTCFALLFLKRSNFAPDLSAKIHHVIKAKPVAP